MTTVEWLDEQIEYISIQIIDGFLTTKEFMEEREKLFKQAKEMEKENTDNKVIHFAEWLTKKHCYALMALYEHFEEEFYNEEL